MCFPGIHGGAADHDNVWAFGLCQWGQGEVPEIKGRTVDVSECAQQAELAGLGCFCMLAFHQTAETAHGEQVAAISICACVPFELQGCVAVSEYHREKVSFMQCASAAVRQFESRVLADFLESREHDVAGLRRTGARQQSGYARTRYPAQRVRHSQVPPHLICQKNAHE